MSFKKTWDYFIFVYIVYMEISFMYTNIYWHEISHLPFYGLHLRCIYIYTFFVYIEYLFIFMYKDVWKWNLPPFLLKIHMYWFSFQLSSLVTCTIQCIHILFNFCLNLQQSNRHARTELETMFISYVAHFS